jgi:hypothetical protein
MAGQPCNTCIISSAVLCYVIHRSEMEGRTRLRPRVVRILLALPLLSLPSDAFAILTLFGQGQILSDGRFAKGPDWTDR